MQMRLLAVLFIFLAVSFAAGQTLAPLTPGPTGPPGPTIPTAGPLTLVPTIPTAGPLTPVPTGPPGSTVPTPAGSCFQTGVLLNNYRTKAPVIKFVLSVNITTCGELCCSDPVCQSVTWLSKLKDSNDIIGCRYTVPCCKLMKAAGVSFYDTNAMSAVKSGAPPQPPSTVAPLQPAKQRTNSLATDLLEVLKILGIFSGAVLVFKGIYWTHDRFCGRLLGPYFCLRWAYKYVLIVMNRKGLLLQFITFFSILLLAIQVSCLDVIENSYKTRTVKSWKANGEVASCEGAYCDRDWDYDDFPLRVNRSASNSSTSYWGGVELQEELQPGDISTVLNRQCQQNDATLQLVTLVAIFLVPAVMLFIMFKSWLTHRHARSGTFAQQVLLEYEMETSFFKNTMRVNAFLAFTSCLLLFVVIRRVIKTGDERSVYFSFIQNMAQFIIGFKPYVKYDSCLDRSLFQHYDAKHGLLAPDIEVSPSYNVLQRYEAFKVTSDHFFRDLIDVLALPTDRFQEINSAVKALDIPHHEECPNKAKEVKKILEVRGLSHLNYEWFTWYTPQEFSAIREFMNPTKDCESVKDRQIDISRVHAKSSIHGTESIIHEMEQDGTLMKPMISSDNI